jgi:site-specific DNA-cytosine methylase
VLAVPGWATTEPASTSSAWTSRRNRNYPFEFHQGDALGYLAAHWREFDVIHASPPCQGYLNLGASTGHWGAPTSTPT